MASALSRERKQLVEIRNVKFDAGPASSCAKSNCYPSGGRRGLRCAKMGVTHSPLWKRRKPGTSRVSPASLVPCLGVGLTYTGTVVFSSPQQAPRGNLFLLPLDLPAQLKGVQSRVQDF